MTIIAWIVLAVVIAAIILMIAAGIEMALREKDEERVERLAEKRFQEMLKNAQIHVKQRLEIIDEMEVRS